LIARQKKPNLFFELVGLLGRRQKPQQVSRRKSENLVVATRKSNCHWTAVCVQVETFLFYRYFPEIFTFEFGESLALLNEVACVCRFQLARVSIQSQKIAPTAFV